MVQMQRRFGQIKPVMGMYLMAVWGFLSVLVFGAYSAAEMHIYPELGLPHALMID